MDYSKLTKAEFKELDERDIHDAVLTWAFDKFDPVTKPEAFNAAPEPIRIIIVAMMLQDEVLNGGFNQFYFNGYHEYSFDYAGIFEFIGCKDTAKIVKKAEEIYEANKDNLFNDEIDPENERAILEAFSASYENDPFEEVTEQYAEIQEEIELAIVAYVKANIDCFGD